MSKPHLLDLFCGAGGASVGYSRAGFGVVGVDINPQPRYPFHFVQADALEVLHTGELEGFQVDLNFDAIHASPPCQAFTVARNIWQREHPDYIAEVREGLTATGLPRVIENVPGSPLFNYAQVCGLSLGLNVKRHRWFESSVALWSTPCGNHEGHWLLVFGHTVLERGKTIGKAKGGGNRIRRKHVGTDRGREAMGIDWMTRDELSEAIPPAYTQFIGEQLIVQLAEGPKRSAGRKKS